MVTDKNTQLQMRDYIASVVLKYGKSDIDGYYELDLDEFQLSDDIYWTFIETEEEEMYADINDCTNKLDAIVLCNPMVNCNNMITYTVELAFDNGFLINYIDGGFDVHLGEQLGEYVYDMIKNTMRNYGR